MKKELLLIGLLALIIIISGCATPDNNESLYPKTIEDCNANDFVCFQQLVSFGLADEKSCEKITLPNVKNMCFYYAARNAQNPTICEKIEEYEDSTFTAYNTKITCEVVSKNQPEKCAQLQIKDEGTWGAYWTQNCLTDLAQLNKDPSLCDSLDDYHRAECYLWAAYAMGNINLCNQLPNDPIEGHSYTRQSKCKIEFNNLKSNRYPNWLENT